jgi:hypothetical protein
MSQARASAMRRLARVAAPVFPPNVPARKANTWPIKVDCLPHRCEQVLNRGERGRICENNMKTQPSRIPDEVVVDVTCRNVPLLANPENSRDLVSTVATEDDHFRAHLDERASKQTRLLEEILSR